jgi:hypothetical protein
LNSGFVVAQAERFAQRVRQEAGADQRAQVVLALRLAYAAEPSDAEVAEAVAFLAEQAERFRAADPAAGPDSAGRALASFCHVLLSANQFLYVD